MATRWVGREKLRRRFNALPELAKRHVRDSMVTGADEIVAMQKRLAPEEDGDLKDAIHWAWRKARIGLMSIGIRAGNAKVRYAHLVEFGTRPHKAGGRFAGAQHPGTSPRPFFWPAYRALKKRVLGRIKRGLRKAVQASSRA